MPIDRLDQFMGLVSSTTRSSTVLDSPYLAAVLSPVRGTVRLTRTHLNLPIKCGDLCSIKLLPLGNDSFAFSLKVPSGDEMSFVVEVMANFGMYVDKCLKGFLLAKALH